MNANIEYRVKSHPILGWKVLRAGQTIAIRTDVLDAIAIAKRFAATEQGPGNEAKVIYREDELAMKRF